MSKSLVQQQIELEQKGIEDAIAAYNKARMKNLNPKEKSQPLPPDLLLLKHCMEPMIAGVEEYLNNKKRGQLRWVKDILRELTPVEIAYLTVSTVIFNQYKLGIPVQGMHESVARAIYDQIQYKRFAEEQPGYVKTIERSLKTSNKTHRRKVMVASKKKFMPQEKEWNADTRRSIGDKLISLLINSTGIIYRKNSKSLKNNECQTLEFHPDTQDWLEEAHKRCETMKPSWLPMVVPPVNWDGTEGGGYYSVHIKLIKKKMESKAESRTPGSQVLDGLNSLQQTEWQINQSVLDIVSELVEREGHRLGVLASLEDIVFPGKPEDFDNWVQEKPEEFKVWKRQMTLAYERQVAEKSKRMAQLQMVGIAKKMKDYKKIYFPYVLDFRGRAYPIPQLLHPQGEDLAKGLLQFATGKPLGKHGGYWLSVHGANVFGFDKASLDDRVEWVRENERLILDSAEDPLGQKFWTEADKPWQFLAFCMEYKGYKEKGPAYKSKLCVAVDGSCNGLQHFAAMLRDEVGGEAVNLRNLKERKDIYSIVAEDVAQTVSETTEWPTSEYQYARLWDGKVDRKIVKRPVMTVPYGVTLRGMGEQIADELRNDLRPEYTDIRMDLFKAGNFLGKLTYNAVARNLVSAITAMDWLKDVARVFNTANMPIYWTTPVGMHVCQHKIKTKTKQIKTMTDKVKVWLSYKQPTDKLNTVKQISGIAPNVVHSLDASHMFMTVNACSEKHNMRHFGFVHDSFGCHAADMQNLYDEIRVQFVRLYSHNVLNDLREQWLSQLPEEYRSKVPELPKFGNLDINEVKEAEYFFA